MAHRFGSIVLVVSGCAGGIGRLTPSPVAASNNACVNLVPTSDQSGVPAGYVRVHSEGGGPADVDAGLRFGLQAGARIGQIGGAFGGQSFAHGWSYDAHADLMGSAVGYAFGVSLGYLVQAMDYGPTVAGTSTMRLQRGYEGTTLSVLGGKMIGEGVGLYGIVGVMLGQLAVGNEERVDHFGKADATGARAQVGIDYQLVKSCSVGIGFRIEAGVEATGHATVTGMAGPEDASLTAGTVAAEIYAALMP